jgi:toxin ParE1/3/4
VIFWTDQALQQLDQAHDYIAITNSDDVALKITLRIVAHVQQLEAFPMSGRIGRVSGTRELVIAGTPFIAAYTIAKERVVVLAAYHSARQWPEVF